MTREFHTVQAPARRGDAVRPLRPHEPSRTSAPVADRAVAGPIPVVVVALVAIIGAAALGLMGNTTGEHVFRGSWEFSRLGGPWLLAAFAGGAIGGWRRGGAGLLIGALAGAVIVGAGSVAYYALSFYDGAQPARRAATLGIGWGVAGTGVGGVLGLIGAAYATALGRHRQPRGGRVTASWIHGAAFGVLGGLLVGEAIALLWVWDSPTLRTMAVLEGIGGIMLVAAGTIGRTWRFAVSAVLAMAVSAAVAPVATTMLRDALRSIGWAGA